MKEKVNSFFKLSFLLALLILNGCSNNEDESKYKIEYIAPILGEMEGKTVFAIKVTDNDTEKGAPGLDINIVPFMHLTSMSHTTPVGTIVDNNNGTYTCTVYYLRATSGDEYWGLTVTASDGVDSSTAIFTPTVGTATGDTPYVVLQGVNDKTVDPMDIPEARKYYLFHDGLSGTTGNHSFGVFIATRESLIDHPAVYVDQILTDETATDWTIGAMIVQVSTDDGSTWRTMTDISKGHWSITGLGGLESGVTGTIQIKLTVDDGIANETKIDGLNDFQTFTVTPPVIL